MNSPGNPGRSRFRRGPAIAAIASSQLGLITRAQLLRLGTPAGVIDEWIASHRLHPLYPGVYLVGHAVAPAHAAELAAVLACGRGAVLSHRSAAELWALIEPARGFGPQITVPNRNIAGPGHIRVHVTKALDPEEIGSVHGIPVTAPGRTIIDLASQAPFDTVAKAYEEGLIAKHFDRETMIGLVAHHRGRRGVRKVRALIERDAPPSVTYREAHWRLLQLIRRSGLRHPETEIRIGPYRVDILWREEKVVVEMDGAGFHSTENRQEADKRRDAELASRGYVVIRVTWRELTNRPEALVARIARTLAIRAPFARS